MQDFSTVPVTRYSETRSPIDVERCGALGRRVVRTRTADLRMVRQISSMLAEAVQHPEEADSLFKEIQQQIQTVSSSVSRKIRETLYAHIQTLHHQIEQKEVSEALLKNVLSEINILQTGDLDEEKRAVLEQIGRVAHERWHLVPEPLRGKVSSDEYKNFLEALPLIDALLTTDVKAMSEEQRAIIHRSIAFTWKNRPLNAYLHTQPLPTKALQFFHTLSYVPEEVSAHEIGEAHRLMVETGLQELLECTTSIQALDARLKTMDSKRLKEPLKGHIASLQQESCLPLGMEWTSSRRMKTLRAAIEASDHAPTLRSTLEEMLHMSDQLQGLVERIQHVRTPTKTLPLSLFYRLSAYVDLDDDLERIFGKEYIENPIDISPMLVPDAQKKVRDFLSATVASHDLSSKLFSLVEVLPDSQPGDVGFHQEVYRSRARGKETKSEQFRKHPFRSIPSLLYNVFRSPYKGFCTFNDLTHADILYAHQRKQRALAVYAQGQTELVFPNYAFENELVRVNFYDRIPQEVKRALRSKWHLSDQECQERVFEKVAELIHQIAERPELYQEISNTVDHMQSRMVQLAMPISFKKAVRSTFQAALRWMGHRVAAPRYRPPLTRIPVGEKREMFCSEFTAAVLKTVQHELDAWIRQELPRASSSTCVAPIIPLDLDITDLTPPRLKELLVSQGGRVLPQSSLSRLLVGSREGEEKATHKKARLGEEERSTPPRARHLARVFEHPFPGGIPGSDT